MAEYNASERLSALYKTHVQTYYPTANLQSTPGFSEVQEALNRHEKVSICSFQDVPAFWAITYRSDSDGEPGSLTVHTAHEKVKRIKASTVPAWCSWKSKPVSTISCDLLAPLDRGTELSDRIDSVVRDMAKKVLEQNTFSESNVRTWYEAAEHNPQDRRKDLFFGLQWSIKGRPS